MPVLAAAPFFNLRVGNDALFLYPDFVCGECRRRVETTQKGAQHGQKRKRRKERKKKKEKKQKKERKVKRKQYRGLYLNPISVPRARARACEGRRLACTCTFTCQDKAGEKHDTVFGAGDFTASADGMRIEISDDMLVGHMRNACSVAMSELDTEADATVKVTLADVTILSHNVNIGE